MQRESIAPRPYWPAKVEALGFDFHTAGDGSAYWSEAACYAFTDVEIDVIEAATQELHRLYLEAVDRVVARQDFHRLHIPERFWSWVATSWQRRDPDLYGRFDLAYDGAGPPKLLEYNADTPTALLEAAVVQWYWLEEVKPDCDQFNSLHERLIAAWGGLRARCDPAMPVHFVGVLEETEDLRTLEYLRDVCRQAGWQTELLDISQVGWNGERFTGLDERPIATLFKLYPWEWMLREAFARHLLADPAMFIEPPWKALLSTKAILPILWEMFPGHPNLLPASFERNRIAGPCVAKPVHGREGAGIELLAPGQTGSSKGGLVYQAAARLPKFDGVHAVIGSWIVAGQAAGIGIREDAAPITTNTSRFVPHYFR